MACLHMKNIVAKLLGLIAVLLGCLLIVTVGALAESVQASMEVRPNTLTGTSTVTVNINVINISDDTTPLSVTLYDPAGNVCSSFGSGGTAYLGPGESKAYSGTWMVTTQELEKGRVVYTARYSTTSSAGERVTTTKPIQATIRHNTARAGMKVDRAIPESGVVEGQTVTIKYVLTNTGTVDLLNIKITDKNINNDVLEAAKIAVGDKVELSTSYVAGASAKTTGATIAYEYVIGDKTEKKEDTLNSAAINVTVPDLVVDLKASELIIMPGQKVDLTCTITNKSTLSYEKLKVTDSTLGDVEPSFSLGGSKEHSFVKSITVNQSGTYQFVVSGVDSTGKNVEFASQEITIRTTNDMESVDSINSDIVPVVLDIVIEADRDIIYSEPSEVVFRVKVTNNGLTTVENVIVAAEGPGSSKRTIRTIEKLEPEESFEFIKRLSASVGGKFQFSASAKDNQGEERSASSNPYQVTFQATKPPATPPPTIPPTAPPVPTMEVDESPIPQVEDRSTGMGTVLLYILAGLLLVILLAVALLFFLDQRRRSPKSSGGHSGSNVVIDSIQRSPHRDYARAPKRGRNDKRSRRSQEPLAPAYAPDDEEIYERPQRKAPEQETPVADMKTFDVDTSFGGIEKDAESAYRRPKKKAEPELPLKTHYDEDDEPSGGMEKTEVYGRDYLSKIRQTPDAVAEPEPKAALSDEDAALLSGSTGQYRLSKRTGSVRGTTEPTVRKVEDPEMFARKQRGRTAENLSNFYDDDDEDAPTPTTRRHRE